MNRLLVAVAASAVLAGASHVISAQTPAARKWTVPRLPDGRPDLQGTWTTQTFTPLQRPERYAGREFLTDEEAAALTKLLTQPGVNPLGRAVFGAQDHERQKETQQSDPTHYDNAVWLATTRPKALSSRRTSLIVDPSNGRLPPLTEAGKKLAAERQASVGFDSHKNRPLQERCVVWTHEGPPMVPPAYNDILRIFQTPQHVAVVRELSTNLPRIIPTDGRPHTSARIRQWAGSSVGRWEGDTLVVETKHYNDTVAVQGATGGVHVLERFTRVSENEIRYRFTVTDPAMWTAPWTVELPMMQTEGVLFEYGCHEGNHDLENILRIARAAEQTGR